MDRPRGNLAILDTDILHLAVMGPPVVRWGQQVVTFRTRKECTLLVYLALSRTPRSREHLASLFWPDRHVAASRNLLRTTLSHLRQHIVAAGQTTVETLTLLRSERDTLRRASLWLERGGWPSLTLDTELVETGVSMTAETVATTDVEALLQAAVAAYRGNFLDGTTFDDAPDLDAWIGQQRVYWQTQVERVVSRLATLQLERRAVVEAAATAQRWISINTLSEPAYRTLMRALAGSGDRTGALAVYEACRAALRTQLALDPAPETVELAERLRRLPASAARLSGSTAATPSGSAQPVDGTGPFRHVVELPFVGREQEFTALVTAYLAARAGRAQVVVIDGEAGIGKTRLAEEFLRWAMLEGADVLQSRGYEAGRMFPYKLLVDAVRPRLAREHAPEDLVSNVWLTELVRLFPELRERYPDLPHPAMLQRDGAAGQGRLFEAVFQLMLALAEKAKPAALVLFYDDVQWTDLATRDDIHYRLARHGEANSPHLLLLAVRTEALASAPELKSWLAELARQAPMIRLTLGPLAQAETAQAITAVLGDPRVEGEREQQFGSWLYAQTEGQPFYLVETLRALVDRGILITQDRAVGSDQAPLLALAPGVAHWPRFVPGTVRELIHGQLDRLTASAVELAVAAAVLGAAATFEHLCQVAAVDEGAGLAALDELRRPRFVVEDGDNPMLGEGEPRGPATVQFSHDLLREAVYTEAGDARRRIFHRRAFALLASSTAPPAELARHALAAGLIEPAFRYSVAAGDAALAIFAVRDALGHYERALRLLTDLDGRLSPPITAEEWVHVHLQLGQAYEWVGSWAQARTIYAALRPRAQATGDATLEGRVLTLLALATWRDAWDIGMARALAGEALGVLDATKDRELLALTNWTAGMLADIAGDSEVARTHALGAQELAKLAGLRELVARSLYIYGLTAVRSGDWDEGIVALRRGSALYATLAGEQAVYTPALGASGMSPLGAFYSWTASMAAAGYGTGEASCVAREGLAAICRGEPRRGLELGRSALRLAVHSGNASAEAFSRGTLATALVEAGYYEEALHVGHTGVMRARDVGLPISWLEVVMSLAYAQQAILGLEEGRQTVAEAVEHSGRLGISRWALVPQSFHCANLALAGDWTGAYAAALKAVAVRRTLPARLAPLDVARHHEIEALVRGGNHELAVAELEGLGERLRGDGTDRRYRLVYLRMQAELARGTGEFGVARRHLAEALDLAEAIGLPGEAWSIAAELAAAFRREGAVAQADASFARAQTTIASLAMGIDDHLLRARFYAAANERARMLST